MFTSRQELSLAAGIVAAVVAGVREMRFTVFAAFVDATKEHGTQKRMAAAPFAFLVIFIRVASCAKRIALILKTPAGAWRWVQNKVLTLLRGYLNFVTFFLFTKRGIREI